MNGILDRSKYEYGHQSKRWQREEVLRKSGISVGKVDVMYYNRTMRNDASLVPPIRQTASIFKQPVTIHKTQESKVKSDFKNGNQEKPKQLMWEKRLVKTEIFNNLLWLYTITEFTKRKTILGFISRINK